MNRSEGKKYEMESPILEKVQKYVENQKINKLPGSGFIPFTLLKAEGGEL